ncbi:hypothetical protein E0H22_08935 [Rhodopseudomonas boonkerdii]|uniref:hypothetical protein n=1 Tax=Rhodopseudomonas boonkerdii TaxID=475937 RepID=UPI001E612E54|nr:hypothetical protein [Rhodopseudomonas boonkerdii]UGV25797.1 hypothetical protein E0H22_08935 [Rhodopseudomonas boonkerdii]
MEALVLRPMILRSSLFWKMTLTFSIEIVPLRVDEDYSFSSSAHSQKKFPFPVCAISPPQGLVA